MFPALRGACQCQHIHIVAGYRSRRPTFCYHVGYTRLHPATIYADCCTKLWLQSASIRSKGNRDGTKTSCLCSYRNLSTGSTHYRDRRSSRADVDKWRDVSGFRNDRRGYSCQGALSCHNLLVEHPLQSV